MIQFLNTSFLYSLPACLIPVIIHFFDRRKRKHLMFSSLLFLQEMKTRQLKFLKLKEILLLILRVLAVLFLILAFSRPVITGSSTKGKKETIVVLDRSASMKRSSVFEEAKKIATEIIQNPEIRAELIFSPSEYENIFSGSKDDLKTMIDRSEPSMSGFKLKNIFRIIQKQGGLFKNVVLVTDNQRSNYEGPDSAEVFRKTKGDLFVVKTRDSTFNVGVTNVNVFQPAVSSRKVHQVSVAVRNFADRPLKSALLRIIIDSNPVEQKLVSLLPKQQKKINFRINNLTPGWHKGEAVFKCDNVEFDNRKYFSFFMPHQIQVFIAGAHKKDIAPFTYALNKETGIFKIRTFYKGDNSWVKKLDSCAVLILSNYPEFDSERKNRIINALNRGLGILYFPGENTDLKNLGFSGFWPMKKWEIRGVIDFGKDKNMSELNRADSDHPVFKDVFKSKGKISVGHLIIRRMLNIKINSGLPLISVNYNMPLFLESSAGSGRFLFCTTGIDEKWSSLKFSAVFPVMVYKSVLYLSSEKFVQGEDYFTDDRTVKIEFKAGDNIKIITPSGKEILPDLNGPQNFMNLLLPGNYSVIKNNVTEKIISVNIRPEESDFTPVTIKKMSDVFPMGKIYMLDSNKDIAEQIKTKSSGISLWRYFLLLSLLAFLSEMFLAKIGK